MYFFKVHYYALNQYNGNFQRMSWGTKIYNYKLQLSRIYNHFAKSNTYPLELLKKIRRFKGSLLPPLMPFFPRQTHPYPIKQYIVNSCRNNCMHTLNQASVIDGKERLMLSWVWCVVPIPGGKSFLGLLWLNLWERFKRRFSSSFR